MSYKKHFIKSVSLMGILQSSSRIISLAKIAVIARILTPSDFGSFGIVVLIVGISEIFSDLGIQTFLIQSRNNADKYISSGWVLQILRGFFLCLLILLLAYPLSMFFKQPNLSSLIALGALIPLIKGFENLYVVKFQKELQFQKELIYRLIIILTDFITSVTLAFFSHSVIALVAGIIGSSLIGTIYSWIFIKERPTFAAEITKIKEIMHSSKWITTNGILYYLTTQLDTIIIGRFLGTGSLGLYQISQKFSFTPMQEIADIIGKVSFPFYTKISNDLNRFRQAYLKTLLGLGLIEVIIAVMLFSFSKTVIQVLLGPQWLETEDLFRLFVTYGFLAAVIGTNGSFFLSIGRQDILTKLSLLRLLIVVPLIGFGIQYWGVQGVVYALIASLLLVAPFSFLNIFLILKK